MPRITEDQVVTLVKLQKIDTETQKNGIIFEKDTGSDRNS